MPQKKKNMKTKKKLCCLREEDGISGRLQGLRSTTCFSHNEISKLAIQRNPEALWSSVRVVGPFFLHQLLELSKLDWLWKIVVDSAAHRLFLRLG